MKLTFYGAAQEVTGSQHLLEVNGKKILLDCGLHQGRRKEADKLNREMLYDPRELDAIVLSHAHIDHSGNLPTAVKKGYKGIILCTQATRDLEAIMLPDSAHIQKYDVEYLNKKRAKQNLSPIEPLYTVEDVMKTMERFVSIPYSMSYPLFDGVTIRFVDAGHILGSVQVEITMEEKGKKRVLVFSGDLGRPGRPILRDPDMSLKADILMMESTYGGRNHEKPDEARLKFQKIINDTYRKGGKIIIPSFSVGRTQEVLYYIHELQADNLLPEGLKVYVDSPLSFDATEVYRLHAECFDVQTREYLLSRDSPFRFKGLRFVQDVGESKALNNDDSPMIIISASGMCESGRILHHLKNNIEDRASTVLIVGFMAMNTLGRRILEHKKPIRIFGNEYKLNATVEVINGFSAHADSDALLSYAATVGENAEQIILVHGEEKQAEALASRILDKTGKEVLIPARGETFELI